MKSPGQWAAQLSGPGAQDTDILVPCFLFSLSNIIISSPADIVFITELAGSAYTSTKLSSHINLSNIYLVLFIAFVDETIEFSFLKKDLLYAFIILQVINDLSIQ